MDDEGGGWLAKDDGDDDELGMWIDDDG